MEQPQPRPSSRPRQHPNPETGDILSGFVTVKRLEWRAYRPKVSQ